MIVTDMSGARVRRMTGQRRRQRCGWGACVPPVPSQCGMAHLKTNSLDVKLLCATLVSSWVRQMRWRVSGRSVPRPKYVQAKLDALRLEDFCSDFRLTRLHALCIDATSRE